MSKDNIIKLIQPGNVDDQLTEILRNGARALLAQAVEAEVADFLGKHADLKTEDGHRRVVRHGHLPEREVMTGITHTAANRVHALISKVFSFAVDADLLEANPVARLKKRGKEATGKRILSDDEIALFWKKIVLSPVSRTVGLALRLALLTAARESEIAGIRLDELHNLNGADPALLIPTERSKNKRPHLIPLTGLAVATIKQAKELTRLGPLLNGSPFPEFPCSRLQSLGGFTPAAARLKAAVSCAGFGHDNRVGCTSVLERTTDVSQTSRHVREVPKSDIDSITIRPLRWQGS